MTLAMWIGTAIVVVPAIAGICWLMIQWWREDSQIRAEAAARLRSADEARAVGGVLLVVRDIVDDRRAAKAAREADRNASQVSGLSGGGFTVGGQLGAIIGQGMARDQQFQAFIDDRLAGGSSRRWLGVALIVIGSSLGFAANLLSLI